jgi:hypothetical protein
LRLCGHRGRAPKRAKISITINRVPSMTSPLLKIINGSLFSSAEL